MFKKYLFIAKNSFTNSISDPGKFYTFFLGQAATAGVLLIFWGAVFRLYPNFKGYTFNTLILYYITGSLLSRLITTGMGARVLESGISKGQLSMTLLQPISWNIKTLVYNIVSRISSSITGFIVLIIITIIFNKSFVNPTSIIFYTIAVILAILLNYYLYASLGVLAFYTTNTRGFRTLYGKIGDLTSGKIFPLDMLSPFLSSIFTFLPFNFTYFFIMQIYLGKINISQMQTGLITQASWVVICILIYSALFDKGMKHYESVGI